VSGIPTAEGIARGLGVILPDLGEESRMWFANLMMGSLSGSPELSDELTHLRLESAVRSGEEHAIRVVLAAARRGLKI
jgi:hypothetical protein